MKPKTKDPRLQQRRDAGALYDAANRLLSGSDGQLGHDGAEREGMLCLQLLLSEFIVGESDLAVRMRRFVTLLTQKEDYLRRTAITHEQWSMLWPVVNQLLTARETHVEQRRQEREKATLSGAGKLGADSASSDIRGTEGGSGETASRQGEAK